MLSVPRSRLLSRDKQIDLGWTAPPSCTKAKILGKEIDKVVFPPKFFQKEIGEDLLFRGRLPESSRRLQPTSAQQSRKKGVTTPLEIGDTTAARSTNGGPKSGVTA